VNDIIFCNDKLLVSCPQGLEIVDIDSFKTQALLDPADAEALFLVKPVKEAPALVAQLLENLYVVCYREYGIYIDKGGRHVRENKYFEWLGAPHSFIYCSPYLFAFDEKFIEVWNATEGRLVLVVPFLNERLLCSEWPILALTSDMAGEEDEPRKVSKIIFIDQV
jgi:RHO1 GDP-GTP exchange protein 1/2